MKILPIKPLINFEDLDKIDIRVGTIEKVIDIEKSDKLVKLIVNFGDPVRVNDYLETYQSNPNAATKALKDKLYDAIDELTINGPDKSLSFDHSGLFSNPCISPA